MNKKLLISLAIATGLLLTACVKKEAPKEEEQQQVEVPASEVPVVEENIQLAELPSSEVVIINELAVEEPVAQITQAPSAPQQTKVAPAAAVETAPAPTPKTEDKPAQTHAAPKAHATAPQSEDDAVADAIAAAMPALEN